jgi:hypothetical protein
LNALTVCQPHAHLIARGEKFVENRTWYTRYKGWIAIHAGKSDKYLSPGDRDLYPDMVFGGIVAVAWLSHCVHIDRLPGMVAHDPRWKWVREHEHTKGPWLWVMPVVWELTAPIPIAGGLGLWTIGKDVVDAARGACAKTPWCATGGPEVTRNGFGA